jgi:hypothetical protein
MTVRLTAEFRGTPAEYLRIGQEMSMNLKTYYALKLTVVQYTPLSESYDPLIILKPQKYLTRCRPGGKPATRLLLPVIGNTVPNICQNIHQITRFFQKDFAHEAPRQGSTERKLFRVRITVLVSRHAATFFALFRSSPLRINLRSLMD